MVFEFATLPLLWRDVMASATGQSFGSVEPPRDTSGWKAMGYELTAEIVRVTLTQTGDVVETWECPRPEDTWETLNEVLGDAHWHIGYTYRADEMPPGDKLSYLDVGAVRYGLNSGIWPTRVPTNAGWAYTWVQGGASDRAAVIRTLPTVFWEEAVTYLPWGGWHMSGGRMSMDQFTCVGIPYPSTAGTEGWYGTDDADCWTVQLLNAHPGLGDTANSESIAAIYDAAKTLTRIGSTGGSAKNHWSKSLVSLGNQLRALPSRLWTLDDALKHLAIGLRSCVGTGVRVYGRNGSGVALGEGVLVKGAKR